MESQFKHMSNNLQHCLLNVASLAVYNILNESEGGILNVVYLNFL
jgi:hypothetical protein